MLDLLFSIGAYALTTVGASVLASRNRIGPLFRSATYQRHRWQRIAMARGLEPTGVPGELTGTWRGLTLVIDAQFAPRRPLVLQLRVLGLRDPERHLRAVHIDSRFRAIQARVEARELCARVPLALADRGELLDQWLDLVRAVPEPESIYRDQSRT